MVSNPTAHLTAATENAVGDRNTSILDTLFNTVSHTGRRIVDHLHDPDIAPIISIDAVCDMRATDKGAGDLRRGPRCPRSRRRHRDRGIPNVRALCVGRRSGSIGRGGCVLAITRVNTRRWRTGEYGKGWARSYLGVPAEAPAAVLPELIAYIRSSCLA